MNDEQRKVALELLNTIVENHEDALTMAWGGQMRESLNIQQETLQCCAKLKELLTSSHAASVPTATVWVGLVPATIERLLATSPEFSRQYEMRSRDCGKPFIERDGIVIEFIGTELGLCLGVKLLILREGLTRLPISEIILTVEEVKKKFAAAMWTLGVPDTKELLEVFVKTT